MGGDNPEVESALYHLMTHVSFLVEEDEFGHLPAFLEEIQALTKKYRMKTVTTAFDTKPEARVRLIRALADMGYPLEVAP